MKTRPHILLASLAFAGAAQAADLTIANPYAPISLDPALSGNGRAGTHVMPAYEPLVRTRADGSFEPALATKWEVAPDSRSVTFTLRPDARFSDGEKVTAEAAKKSIDYWRTKKGPFSLNLAAVTSIEVLDGLRFRINLSSSNPDIVSLFDAYWLSGDLISPKAIDTPDVLGRETFGAGPYKLDPSATISGKSYTYIPNPYYYDQTRIKWDKMVIGTFEDANSGIQALKSGQLKLMISDPLTANANAANLPADLRIISYPVQWIGLYLMDRDGIVNPALKDIRVRQALNFGVDRKVVAQALFGKYGDATVQIQSKGFMGHDDANEAKYPYDVAKAKALLAEAGYGKGLEIKVSYVNNTMSSMLTQALAGQYRKIGVTVKPLEMQNFGALANATAQKAYDSEVFITNSGVPNLAKFQTLEPNGSLNVYHTQDAELTRLLAEASAISIDKAEPAWKKVYSRVVDLAWFVPVVASHVVYFAADSVTAPSPGASVVIDLINVVPAKR